jgi:ubiquinone/menaquinone biosynthesis C-methylase UbiE
VDRSATAIVQAKSLATELLNDIESDQFRVENVERMSFSNETFDVVVSSAVLHFANDEEHWQAMVSEMWRVLKPGGIFFARLASTVGIEDQIQPINGRRYHLPDGSDRFLVDFEMLDKTTKSLGGEWLEPFKTVVVHNLRSMSNWCLRKM